MANTTPSLTSGVFVAGTGLTTVGCAVWTAEAGEATVAKPTSVEASNPSRAANEIRARAMNLLLNRFEVVLLDVAGTLRTA
jgi:hypothetical protein